MMSTLQTTSEFSSDRPSSRPVGGWRWTERLGLAMLLLTGSLFGILTLLVSSETTQAFDESVIKALRHPGDGGLPAGPRWFIELAREFTALV